jgi:tetratricopeptide (TPR) repeat protein
VVRALGCLAAASVLVLGSGSVARGDTYAFLVGVSDYESKDELRPLKFACDDMISFAGVLRNQGVPQRNIVLLHDRQSNPRFKPLRGRILKEFHLLLATLEPEDTLIVALAGHGVQIGGSAENYFLPADAQLKDPATLINVKTLYEEMDNSQAGRKLLFVDACRNDPEADNARSAGVALQPPRRLASDPVPKGIAALFSCNSDQRSFEDPALRHGIFFYQVIKAWEGAADANQNGQVTLDELESFVRKETKAHARDALSAIQTPVSQVDRTSANAWVVATSATATATATIPQPEPERPAAVDVPQRAGGPARPGDDTAAERAFLKTLGTAPNSVRAHLGLARIYHVRGDLTQALREYSAAIRLGPNDASAYVGRAVVQGASGDLAAALADYERAIRIDPGSHRRPRRPGGDPDPFESAGRRDRGLQPGDPARCQQRQGLLQPRSRPRREEGPGRRGPGLPEGRAARPPPPRALSE